MKKLLLLAGLCCCFSCTDRPAATGGDLSAIMSADSPDSLLRHAVLFSFNEASYPEGVAEVEAAFAALPAKIPQIHSYEWGTNNSPEGLDKGYTHMFLLTFKSEADRAAYLPHPDHKAFGEILGPHLKDVLVLDYWTK